MGICMWVLFNVIEINVNYKFFVLFLYFFKFKCSLGIFFII